MWTDMTKKIYPQNYTTPDNRRGRFLSSVEKCRKSIDEGHFLCYNKENTTLCKL